MRFIQYEELLLKIKENVLEDIIEDTGITSGSTILSEIEQEAIDEVRVYCDQFYNVDTLLSAATGQTTGTTSGTTNGTITRDKFLVKLIIDIMLYNISMKLTPDNIPSIRQIRYDQTKSDLEKISKRIIVPNWPLAKRDSETENTSEMLWYSEEKTNTTY